VIDIIRYGMHLMNEGKQIDQAIESKEQEILAIQSQKLEDSETIALEKNLDGIRNAYSSVKRERKKRDLEFVYQTATGLKKALRCYSSKE
jgi:hypothetical protein